MKRSESFFTFTTMIKSRIKLNVILEYAQHTGIGIHKLKKITDLIKEKWKYIFLKIYFLSFLSESFDKSFKDYL